MVSFGTCHVEFIGGPFDGHVESFPSHNEVPSDLIWFVSRGAYHRLDGESSEAPPGHITSAAFYERFRYFGDWYYVFLGAFEPQMVALQLWNRS
ncbi:MAG: hypothetical protein KDA60_09955 [Planctomycetales bacterium]|nr:hypothetical protein [Planctomycetales bacterium]